MYASLHYRANSTPTLILSDVVKVLTGETNLANLSASVLQADSFITSTIAAGWTLFDDVSATVKVLRSPIYDDPTRYKYLWMSVSTNDIVMEYYTDWNNVSHTGTRVPRYDINTNGEESIFVCRSNVRTETMLMISASADHAVFHSCRNNLDYSSGSNITSLAGIMSMTRAAAWDTVANAYDPVVVTGRPLDVNVFATTSSNLSSKPFIRARVPKSSTLDAMASSSNETDRNLCRHSFSIPFSFAPTANNIDNYLNGISNFTLDANKQFAPYLIPIHVTRCESGNVPPQLGGNISEKCGIYLIPAIGKGQINDFVRVGSDKYRIWRDHTSTGYNRFAIKEA